MEDRRPRSSTIIHQPDEIYNIPSEERSTLLSELQGALNVDTVKAPFWSCLQVCDISKLRELVMVARSTPARFFSLLEDTSLSIPLVWMQRPPRDITPSTPSTPSGHSARRLERPKKLAKERDLQRCVLTGGSVFQVAHIFPHCLINPRKPSNLDASIPEFWKMLDFFFEADRLNRWRAEMFSDPSNQNVAIDGCHNLICLNALSHDLWVRGLFALRPVSLSNDRTELVVQFYWQPRASHGQFDAVGLLKRPISSKDLIHVERNFISVINEGGTETTPIKSGDTFIFKTTNPDTHPLPSFQLLDMQWHLNRIVAMCGASEIYDSDNDDDDDHCDAGAVYSPTGIESWLSSLSDTFDEDRVEEKI